MAEVDIQESPRGIAGDVARRSVVLAVLVVPILLACWRLGVGRPLGSSSFVVYLGVVALLVACERWLPFDRRWGSALGGTRTDVCYVVVATLMDKATFFLCMTAVAAVGHAAAARMGVVAWPTDWSLPAQVALALLVADAFTYVRHRVVHESDLLWRFHRIHHSMTELYWIRSAYTHPLEQLFILTAIMLPISFLGAGDAVVATVAFLFGVSGLLQHANVDARSSVFNWIFATPEVHRVHHRADDGRHANFSAFFVFMDLLWGTYTRPPSSPTLVRVGLGEGVAFPRSFLSHLTMPFQHDPEAIDGTARPEESVTR